MYKQKFFFSKLTYRIYLNFQLLTFIFEIFSAGSAETKVTEKKSLLSLHDECVLSNMLLNFRAAALIGVEYVLEVWWQGVRDPKYQCLLCNFRCGIREIMYHLLSAQHRLAYLVSIYSKYCTVFVSVCGLKFKWLIPL